MGLCHYEEPSSLLGQRSLLKDSLFPWRKTRNKRKAFRGITMGKRKGLLPTRANLGHFVGYMLRADMS